MAYGTINADVIGTSVANTSLGAGNASIMKNRIINGAMVIDQRNNGVAISNNGGFPVDRFKIGSDTTTFTAQQSTTTTTGFKNSLIYTVGAGGSPSAAQQNQINHFIEGFNVADLGWGTANAQTITFSFWVRSSVTGTFAGSLMNGSYNRAYVFTYSVPVANTWTQASVTIAGDTTGTWATDNTAGIRITFDLGSGSNYNATAGVWSAGEYRRTSGSVTLVSTAGATFYITGVQLEVGSSATGFEYVNYQTSLANCQRYCQVLTGVNNQRFALSGQGEGNNLYPAIYLKTTMRSAPSMTASAASDFKITTFADATYAATSIGTDVISADIVGIAVGTGTALGGNGGFMVGANSNAKLTFSAEL